MPLVCWSVRWRREVLREARIGDTVQRLPCERRLACGVAQINPFMRPAQRRNTRVCVPCWREFRSTRRLGCNFVQISKYLDVSQAAAGAVDPDGSPAPCDQSNNCCLTAPQGPLRAA